MTGAGIYHLNPSGTTALLLGLLLVGLAVAILRSPKFRHEWRVLALAGLVIGIFSAAGGIYSLAPDFFDALAKTFANFYAHHQYLCLLALTAILLGASIFFKNALLAALAVVALAASIGAMTDYEHAEYFLTFRHPTLTVGLFSVLAFVAYRLTSKVPLDYESVATVFARTSLFLVNIGFWVGSLWGDDLKFGQKYGARSYTEPSAQPLPDWVFAVVDIQADVLHTVHRVFLS